MPDKNIVIIYGSDTSNTEDIALLIQQYIGEDSCDVYDIAETSPAIMEDYPIILIGIPTWFYGELQCDWDDALPDALSLDFSGKLVGMFGCGDQKEYAEYFLDAIGIVAKEVEKKGATIVGKFPIQGFSFKESKALCEDDPSKFYGLGIDEDCQPDLTEDRVKRWIEILDEEVDILSL